MCEKRITLRQNLIVFPSNTWMYHPSGGWHMRQGTLTRNLQNRKLKCLHTNRCVWDEDKGLISAKRHQCGQGVTVSLWQLIKTETIWPPFGWRHLQLRFLERKWCSLIWLSPKDARPFPSTEWTRKFFLFLKLFGWCLDGSRYWASSNQDADGSMING